MKCIQANFYRPTSSSDTRTCDVQNPLSGTSIAGRAQVGDFTLSNEVCRDTHAGPFDIVWFSAGKCIPWNRIKVHREAIHDPITVHHSNPLPVQWKTTTNPCLAPHNPCVETVTTLSLARHHASGERLVRVGHSLFRCSAHRDRLTPPPQTLMALPRGVLIVRLAPTGESAGAVAGGRAAVDLASGRDQRKTGFRITWLPPVVAHSRRRSKATARRCLDYGLIAACPSDGPVAVEQRPDGFHRRRGAGRPDSSGNAPSTRRDRSRSSTTGDGGGAPRTPGGSATTGAAGWRTSLGLSSTTGGRASTSQWCRRSAYGSPVKSVGAPPQVEYCAVTQYLDGPS